MEVPRIGISNQLSILYRCQIGKTGQRFVNPLCKFLDSRHLKLKGDGSMQYIGGVDIQ